jgi:hypothetical protein
MSDDAQHVELLELDIESLLSFFIGLTSTKALQYLGVTLKEGEKSKKDIEKARFAIDTTIALVEKLEPHVEAKEKTQLRQILSNLQFTYLRESN